MYVKTGRFVYGELQPQGLGRFFSRVGGDDQPEFAVEIIREYSANEFVGKLHRKGYSGEWMPVDPGTLESPEWQQRFSATPPGDCSYARATHSSISGKAGIGRS